MDTPNREFYREWEYPLKGGYYERTPIDDKRLDWGNIKVRLYNIIIQVNIIDLLKLFFNVGLLRGGLNQVMSIKTK